MEHIIFNGKQLVAETAIISANNRGLRFGDGLFETMKSINGQVQFLDEHFARLWNGLQILQFTIPKHFTPDQLQDEITGLLKRNGHQHLARIRLTVFRGDGGLYDELNHKPNYIIQTWALPETNGDWNSNGLVLGIYTDVKKSCDILSNIKHNNFLPYALAAMHAKTQKWNDALLLNTEDRLCDTTIANIFIIKDGLVYTPPLSDGCVAGVMRKNIIRLLHAHDFKFTETGLTTEDLLNADEVFLTNSIYNLRWVQLIGDKKYTNILSQKIYARCFQQNPDMAV